MSEKDMEFALDMSGERRGYVVDFECAISGLFETTVRVVVGSINIDGMSKLLKSKGGVNDQSFCAACVELGMFVDWSNSFAPIPRSGCKNATLIVVVVVVKDVSRTCRSHPSQTIITR
jgi:hypothetical protein